jgi:predicted phosphoribosyltransferase
MPKVFSFRGLTFDQLKQLSIEEFARLLNSKERRTLKRGLQ